MNYKGLKFTNTLNEFKRWCKTFPPLEIGSNREFAEDGDYYLSMEVCKGLGASRFMGVTVAHFDDDDFDVVDYDGFQAEIEEYSKRHNATYWG